MTRNLITAAVLASGMAFTVPAFAADIEGNWRTQSGETAAIAKCGGSYCITLKTGDHAGKSIGKMKGSGSSYKGKITDPADDQEYSGSATVSGSSLKMKGCALVVLCKTQTWNKI